MGAKRALKSQQVWAIRLPTQRALFVFAIDSQLRGCDVVEVRIGDIVTGSLSTPNQQVAGNGSDLKTVTA